MKKYEHYDKHGFFTTWRIVPAFMSDGVRVFRHEEYKEEKWAFNEAVFKSEEEAEAKIEKYLKNCLKVGLIPSYTVKER